MAGTVEIRSVDVADIEAYQRTKTTTFLDDPSDIEKLLPLRRAHWDSQRTWGAYADGRIVGTLRTIDVGLTVPGANGHTADIRADGLTSVTVAATHRRQGLLRRLLSGSLAAAKERGDAVSILVAAEWPIYGRFGYWPAATWADLTVTPRRPGAHLRQPVTGGLRQADPDELRQVLPGLFDIARRQRSGQITRDAQVWDQILLPQYRSGSGRAPTGILHEGPDGIDGYVSWKVTKDFEFVDGGKIEVEDLFATNQAAYSALWGYLIEMDVVEEITVFNRPPDEPLPWLLVDGRSVQTKALVDTLWLRLLDVPAALSARSYSVPGQVCLEVSDDDIGGYGAGRFLVDGGPDGAQCRPEAARSADLRISQRALAAIYLGQPTLAAQHSAGLVEELTPGALARTAAMFATPLQPWLGTGF